MKKIFALPFFFVVLLVIGCENSYFPKPRGFFRIDLPPKDYAAFDTANFPYSFSVPAYAKVLPDYENPNEPYWVNISFTTFDATIYLSYKKVNNNIDQYLEDAHMFVTKHIPKASAINENLYINAPDRVFGLVYDIEGSQAASPLQFYLTDSTKNFVRGALYFNYTPNNDSLEPIINYIKQDVNVLIETFRWKNTGNK